MLVSKSELRNLTGNAVPTITKRLEKLKYKKGPRNAQLYESKAALPILYSSSSGSSYEQERTRLTKAQADLTELNVSEKNGTLLDSDVVHEMLMGKVMAARSGLLSLPSRIAPIVMSAKTMREVEDFAREIVYQVLNNLADGITEDNIENTGGVQASAKTDSKRMGAAV